MEEARVTAAECWNDKVSKEEAVAKQIAYWMQTAAFYEKNAEYYRSLVDRCGEAIGLEAYIADDGGRADDVLCAKVPEIVERMCSGQVA